ncbi:hypothetical protein TrVE_jg13655 [Triparma verrucosa]|uniref:Uncharacterized protein n=1 Tax=Triparma verrucosa TaxID=1606542 RepID=A0A9W7F7H6_9STRA|nr:hypothetical protein TrVE_jg13655 [Triparma verrucosa]
MRIITADRQIVKSASRQSIVSTLEGSGTRCTNCLSEDSMILYSSASGTTTKLSQINDEDMENDKTTYKLLPCEHETTETENKPLTLTYRVYPSCQPPIVPHSISLMITENAEQHNTLETGSTTWDGATYLVRFLDRHFSELGASGRFIELGAGTGFVGLHCSKAWPSASGVLTDLNYTLPSISQNITLNNTTNLSVSELDWFASSSATSPPPISLGSFKTILAADCIYLKSLIQPFCSTVLKLMSESTEDIVTAIIAHQVRGGGGTIEAEVESIFKEGGATVERREWKDNEYYEPRLFIWIVKLS